MLDKSMNTYKAIIKANHKMYIESLSEIEKTNLNIEQRFLNLKRKILGLLRKKEKSINSIKFLPTITRVLFGLQEDISRLKLPYYSFENEKKIINHFIISFLEDQKNTKFNGKCNYG
jgi:hypothetical protein